MEGNVKTEIRTVEFNDGTKYDLEVDIDTPDSQVQAAAEKQYADDNAPEINNFAEGARKVGQGLTLGFADEIEAKFRAGGPGVIQLPDDLKALSKENNKMLNRKFAGKLSEQELAIYDNNSKQIQAYQNQIKQSYKDKYTIERDKLRSQGDEFTRQNPKAALALEVGGGLLMPGGLARTGAKQLLTKLPGALKTPGAQMVGYGAGYGAGAADESSDMLGNALVGAGTSLVGGKLLSGAGGLIAPKLSNLKAGARDFIENRGINLTPGQAKGGLVDFFEQKASTFIPGMKERRAESVMEWNKSIANKVLAPLGKKLHKDVSELDDFSREIRKQVNIAYDEVAENLVIKKSANLNNKLKALIADATERGEPKIVIKALKSEINWVKSQINRGKNTNGLTGKSAQLFLSDAKKRVGSYRKGMNSVDASIEPWAQKVLKSVDGELGIQNPIYKPKLDNINSAYSDIVKFDMAVKNKVGVGFTPKQLRNANTSGEMNKHGKLKEGAQQNKMLGKEANIANDILSTTNPDSGTFGNTIAGLGGLFGLGGLGVLNSTNTGEDKKDYSTANKAAGGAAGFAGLTWALYTKPGQAALRKYLMSGGTKNGIADFLRKYAPRGGLLAEQTSEESGLDSLLGVR